MPTALTPTQIEQYYKEQGNVATPLSPLAWLETQNKTEPTILSTENARNNLQKNVLEPIAQKNQQITDLQSQETTPAPEKSIETTLAEEDMTEEEKIAKREQELLEKKAQDAQSLYDNSVSLLSDTAQAQIQSLKSEWEQRKAILEESNRANLATWRQGFTRTGQAEYSPGITSDFLTVKEQQGQSKVADLDRQYNNKIAEINAALAQNKYKLAALLQDDLNEIEQSAIDLAKKQVEEATSTNKQLRVDNAVFNAIQSGFTSVEDIFGNTSGLSASEIKNSLDNFAKEKGTTTNAFTGDSKNFFELKQNYPEYLPTSISMLPENEQLGAYIDWIEGGSGSGAKSSGQVNSVPGMDTYDKGILTARIGKQIYGTKISNTEGERVEGFITAGMQKGKSEFEIMDDVLGFKIERNKPLAENLRNTLLSVAGESGLAGFDMLGIARLINDGNDAQAVQRVEQIVYNKAKELEPDFYIGETTARYTSQKTDEVRGLIEDMQTEKAGLFDNVFGKDTEEAPIGVIKGTMENWLGRFRGENATKIRSSITSLVSEMRNRLSGTAVTESEAKFLEPLIPSLSDSPANFMAKLSQLEQDPLLRLNVLRQTFNLPTLNKNTLSSSSARVPLYLETSDPLGLTETDEVIDPLGLGI